MKRNDNNAHPNFPTSSSSHQIPNGPSGHQNMYTNLKSTDRLLPIANIAKIMKNPIPRNAKVSKDSKEVMQKAASEFIAIISSAAKDICESENRKTLTGEDLIRGMEQLGMSYYANIAKVYMKRYREQSHKSPKKRLSNTDDSNSINYGRYSD